VTHPDGLPSLVYADEQGTICDLPELGMAGMAHGESIAPALEDLIELPEGSELFLLPDRLPVGTDRQTGEPLLLEEHPDYPGRKIQAVAAFMAPAHTAILTSSYQSRKDRVLLPLFAYTAVGWYRDRFWVAAFRSDPDPRQDFRQFNQSLINRRTEKLLERYQHNRLVQHLGHCCLTYHCPAARNFFLGRWEAPLPTSPSCNARCIGCISLQPSGCCQATQSRIDFVPSAQEVSEIALDHIGRAERPIVSFGQGCEGEPLLQDELLEESIGRVRNETSRGTINLNSNASRPGVMRRLAAAGLDSIRVSLNSARPDYYASYYRPSGYGFTDVVESIKIMKQANRFVSLNYFILPGFTDAEEETTALFDLVEQTGLDFIQLRNLNMDPEWYLASIGSPPGQPRYGMKTWLSRLQQAFPSLGLGYFNPYLSGAPVV
jgi:pyruvate-formate lyase-activating enzyme